MSTEPFPGYAQESRLRLAERRLAEAMAGYEVAYGAASPEAQKLSRARVREVLQGRRNLKSVLCEGEK